MRVVFVALVLVGAASAAAAQSRGGLTNDMPTPSIGLPLPHIGLPLPPMGLPLPQMGLPPERSQPLDRVDRAERSERTSILERSERIERPERIQRSRRFERPPSYLVLFGWPYLPQTAYPASPSSVRPDTIPTGRVYLSLHSGVDPQIFVDGYYVGLFSDFGGRLTLEAGLHMLELREERYQNLRLEVNLAVDEVITYDVDLTPIETPSLPAIEPIPAPPLPPPAPSTIYVIPGCYVGNVPPQQVGLRAGCDARNAIEFPSH